MMKDWHHVVIVIDSVSKQNKSIAYIGGIRVNLYMMTPENPLGEAAPSVGPPVVPNSESHTYYMTMKIRDVMMEVFVNYYN